MNLQQMFTLRHLYAALLVFFPLYSSNSLQAQWLDVSIPRSDYMLTSAAFRDNQNLFVAGILDNGAGVFHYSISQESWKAPFIWIGQTTTLNAIASVAGQVVGVGHLDDCQCGFLVISTNNGDTWRQSMIDTVAGINDLLFTNDNTGYFVGYNGALFATHDFGDSWTKVNAQFPVMVEDQDFTHITASSPLSLYIVSKTIGLTPDKIYHSIDAGSSWKLLNDFKGDTSIANLLFLDSFNGLAVGSEKQGSEQVASIFRTTDAGTEWTRVYQNSTIHSINGISRISGSMIVAVGDSGVIVRSTDNGSTWNPDPSPITSSLNAIATQAAHTAAVGLSASVVLSSNANAVKQKFRNSLPSVAITDSKIIVSHLEPDGYNVRLVDLLGRTIRESTLNGPTIELDHHSIASGTYFLELSKATTFQPYRIKCLIY